MLYININTAEVAKSRTAHVEFFRCRVGKKISGKSCSISNCPVCKKTKRSQWTSNRSIRTAIEGFLTPQKIAKILEGLPPELETINRDLYAVIDNILPRNKKGIIQQYFLANDKQKKLKQFLIVRRLFADLSRMFDYDWFIEQEPDSDYNAYTLAFNLDRRSCTYCNRTYTTTMKTSAGKKVMRPHFDHWFPKSKYPLLALSFYNLIPSCYTCNSSVKKDIELILGNHTHPYVDATQTDDFEFDYYYNQNLNKYVIFLKEVKPGRTKSTLEELEIHTMYNSHLPELEDMITIEKSYSKTYLVEIKKLFNNQLTDNQIYRILFGTELNTVDFHKRPLSKFKKDILRKLEIID